MITGIRSALIREKVETSPAGGANYLNVFGDALVVESRPGVVEVWAALQLDLDRRATSGHVRIYMEGYDTSVPFDIPAGWSNVDLSVPLLVPVEKEGWLTVAVTDDARAHKPIRNRWRVEFDPHGTVLDPDAARTFLADARRASGYVASSLVPRRKTH